MRYEILDLVRELSRGWKYRGEFSSREKAEAKFAFIIALGWEVDIRAIEGKSKKVDVYVRSPADLAKIKLNP